MQWKERAGWAALGVMVLAVIAGTVTIPEGLKNFWLFEPERVETPVVSEVIPEVEVLPERSGLRKPKAPRDADVDATIYNSRQRQQSDKTGENRQSDGGKALAVEEP